MKTLIRSFAGGFLALLFSLFVAFTTGDALTAATRLKSQPPVDPAQHQTWLTEQVRHRLAMLPWYSVFDNLEYRVKGDTVTLLGQVTRPVIKNEAESSVK